MKGSTLEKIMEATLRLRIINENKKKQETTMVYSGYKKM